MEYPTELELFEFFEVEPVVENDVYAYTTSDDSGISLTLSFSTADDSLQTSLQFAGRVIAVICHEGITRLTIHEDVLTCEFVQEDSRVTLTARTRPQIHVEWSGLRTV